MSRLTSPPPHSRPTPSDEVKYSSLRSPSPPAIKPVLLDKSANGKGLDKTVLSSASVIPPAPAPLSRGVIDDDDDRDDQASPTPSASSSDQTIDMEIFQQITALDDEGDYTFSHDMVTSYFEQAELTFAQMDAALSEKSLIKLSDLGHFLKGSSAALGVTHVKDLCEKIQNVGKKIGEKGETVITEEEALKRIDALLKRVKADFKVAELWLMDYYAERI